MFKQIGQLSQLFRQAQEMGGRLAEVQQRLARERVIGSAGGGMVEVEVSGTGQIVRVKIDPLLVQRQEVEMVEELVRAAGNQALAKSKQLMAEMMKQITGGLDLPIAGWEEALSQMTGQAPDSTPPGSPRE